MKIIQLAADVPVLEPITRAELLTHLRLDSGTFDGNLTLTQSLAYGSKAVTTAHDHYGAGIDVLGKQADAVLHHGANSATGTVDTIIQESDINTETIALDVAPATDWAADDIITGQTSGTTCIVVAKLTTLTYTVKNRTGLFTLGESVGVTGTAGKLADQGATKPTFSGSGYAEWKINNVSQPFTQVTIANDNADYKKQYTGVKQYIRTASKVLADACEFGTSILVNSAVTAEDDDLTDLITEGRQTVENICRRALLTQAFDYYLDAWPDEDDFIKLPFGNLVSAGLTLSWKDTDGTETTLTVTTDYLVETNGEGIGRIVLPYGVSWPTGTLYPSDPIKIHFVCGWTEAALVPKNIKRAVKFAAEDAYYHGNRHDVLKTVIMNLLASYRLYDEF